MFRLDLIDSIIVSIVKIMMLSFLLRSTSSQKDSLSMQPKSSPTRMIISLDGVWNFRYVNYSLSPNYGFDNDWHIKSLDLVSFCFLKELQNFDKIYFNIPNRIHNRLRLIIIIYGCLCHQATMISPKTEI